ncbi:MAG: iron-containing redox enzyme family protein, partial [Myxococcales bacterium]|nr:iron-containing redox enzyme family protein [Myxococcales bacterium]
LLWALLEIGRSFKQELFGRQVPALVADLGRAGELLPAGILREQLHDELGRSERGESHFVLYAPMLAALERWRTPDAARLVVEAGVEITRAVIEEFTDAALYGRLGAYFATEIAAGDIIAYISQTVHALPLRGDAVAWVEVHDVVELEHTAATLDLPALLPDDGAAGSAFWRGAERMMLGFWRCFDRFYALYEDLQRGRAAPSRCA